MVVGGMVRKGMSDHREGTAGYSSVEATFPSHFSRWPSRGEGLEVSRGKLKNYIISI